MSQLLHNLAAFCARHNLTVIAVWIVAAALIGFFGFTQGGPSSTDPDIPGTESQQAFDLLEERFPVQAGSTVTVVFAAPERDSLTSAESAASLDDALADLASAPQVVAVGNPIEDGTITDDGSVAFADVRYAVPTEDVDESDVEALEQAVEPLLEAGFAVEFRGEPIDATAEPETFTAEIVGISVAVVVLLFAFGSVVAAFTSILTGILGVATTLMSLSILSNWLSINEFAPILATMIGLAVGIDYALFVVSRHRQFLHDGLSVHEAIGRAAATSGGAVLFAGITVIIAIASLAVLQIPVLTSMGLSAALAVFVSIALALTFLPAVLARIGHKIDSLSMPGMKPKTEEGQNVERTLSARWAKKVTSQPVRWLAVGLVLMGLLAVPVLSMRLGVPDDGAKSETRTERQAHDLLADGFGPGINGPFSVVVDLQSVGGEQRPNALSEIRSTLGDVPGVAAAEQAISNEEGDTAIISVVPTTGPDEEETVDTLRAIRDTGAAVANQTGSDIAVTGLSAINIDQAEKLSDSLPFFLIVVIGLTFLLLLVVFRSAVVPLQAAFAILLSILAALGVVVAVFQWGWGAGLIGLDESVPLLPVLPALMFAILFGLSMDYEVFIVSRIREKYVELGDNTEAVNAGLAATARIITAAALIMISVFASFALSPSIETKMFGVGLATAVLLDATIVRMIMVPSMMTLMKKSNWWLPGWLDRSVPHVDIEGARLNQTR